MHIKNHHFKEKIVVQKSISLNKLSEGLFNQSSTVKNLAEIQPPVELVCNTCKREIDSEMCRILIARNINREPHFFSFHFFSPCWDIDDFCQKHPNLTIDTVRFSVLENSISENGIKDLQNNLSYWVTERK